jgi:hypothetical protein
MVYPNPANKIPSNISTRISRVRETPDLSRQPWVAEDVEEL